jgi:hypothetical protein
VSPAIHPESLARNEAITSYCEKADPASGSGYVSKLAGVVHGHSPDEIQRDRATDRYQRALAKANEMLASVPVTSGVRACAEFLADNE